MWAQEIYSLINITPKGRMIRLSLVHSPLNTALWQIFLFLHFLCLGFFLALSWQTKYCFLLVLFLLTCILSNANLILLGNCSPSYCRPLSSSFSLYIYTFDGEQFSYPVTVPCRGKSTAASVWTTFSIVKTWIAWVLSLKLNDFPV